MAVLGEGGGTKGGYKPPKKQKPLRVKTPPSKPKKGDPDDGWTEIKPKVVKLPRLNERQPNNKLSFTFDDQNVDTSRVNVLKRGGRIPPMSDWDALMLREVRSQGREGWDKWLQEHPGMAPKVRTREPSWRENPTTPRPKRIPLLRSWQRNTNRGD